jgi:hypothetical protein
LHSCCVLGEIEHERSYNLLDITVLIFSDLKFTDELQWDLGWTHLKKRCKLLLHDILELLLKKHKTILEHEVLFLKSFLDSLISTLD